MLEVRGMGEKKAFFSEDKKYTEDLTLELFRELDEMEIFTLATGHRHLHNLVFQYFYT